VWIGVVSIEIVSLPTPKPAFCAGSELLLGVGSEFSGCWKCDGVESESKLAVGSEGLTILDLVFSHPLPLDVLGIIMVQLISALNTLLLQL